MSTATPARLASWIRLGGSLATCLGLSACGLLESRTDIHAYNEAGVLTGHVRFAKGTSRVIVAAYKLEGGRAVILQAIRLAAPGDFELMVPGGEYRVVAFDDGNSNAQWDPGEPCRAYAGSTATTAGRGSPMLYIELATADSSCALPSGTSFEGPWGSRIQDGQAGAVGSLGEDTEASARGRDGYWTPMSFLRNVGSNILFIEPYDPGKIPIVFVHGAAGSPRDWKYFVEHIDHTRYQAWIFQYASGAPLSASAEQLYRKLAILDAKFHPPLMVIAAHSMGGLVARKLLVGHGAQLPALRLFVSISTPWGGDAFAATGAALSPTVVPSWIDLVPDGEFLRTLFATPLPAGIEHVLFFSHARPPGWGRSNNDGTVTLASQLSWHAQAEATIVRGFDEDHGSILSSPRVMLQFNRVLRDFANSSGVEVRRTSLTERRGSSPLE